MDIGDLNEQKEGEIENFSACQKRIFYMLIMKYWEYFEEETLKSQ